MREVPKLFLTFAFRGYSSSGYARLSASRLGLAIDDALAIL